MSRTELCRRLRESWHLQVALDLPDLAGAVEICRSMPVQRVILEVGTPLLKSYGVEAIRSIKKGSRGRIVVADTKTLDAADVEVRIAKEGGADVATVSALAPRATTRKFADSCRELNMVCAVDLLGCSGDLEGVRDACLGADILICHVGIDEGSEERSLRTRTKALKEGFPDKLIAAAGGIVPNTATALVRSGADIIIVGRYITASENPGERAAEFTRLFGPPEIGRESTSA